MHFNFPKYKKGMDGDFLSFPAKFQIEFKSIITKINRKYPIGGQKKNDPPLLVFI